MTHRHGGIVETIIEREADADLVVMGKRGASSDFAKGHLGSKVERVVRGSAKPVLVASREFRPIKRALIAYDGGESAKRAVRYLASAPVADGIAADIVMVGADDAKHRRALSEAAELLPQAETVLLAGSVDEVLVAEVEARGADLLVMGAYGHSALRRLIVGSTTTAMVRSCRVPVLLFR